MIYDTFCRKKNVYILILENASEYYSDELYIYTYIYAYGFNLVNTLIDARLSSIAVQMSIIHICVTKQKRVNNGWDMLLNSIYPAFSFSGTSARLVLKRKEISVGIEIISWKTFI